MLPNEEVVLHAGTMLTTIVHPTIMRFLDLVVYGTSKPYEKQLSAYCNLREHAAKELTEPKTYTEITRSKYPLLAKMNHSSGGFDNGNRKRSRTRLNNLSYNDAEIGSVVALALALAARIPV